MHEESLALVGNPFLRRLLFGAGCLSTVFGVVGIFLPLVPTTPFILMAAWCFLRSSPKAHSWLRKQPVLGRALEDWEKNRSISRKNKVMAGAVMAVSVVVIWMKVESLGIKALVTFILSTVSLFIFTRTEKRP